MIEDPKQPGQDDQVKPGQPKPGQNQPGQSQPRPGDQPRPAGGDNR